MHIRNIFIILIICLKLFYFPIHQKQRNSRNRNNIFKNLYMFFIRLNKLHNIWKTTNSNRKNNTLNNSPSNRCNYKYNPWLHFHIEMYFHYKKNKEISSNIKYLKPNIKLIKAIYKIGLSATLMQTLLAIMMSGMNAILNLASTNQTILVGSFGIYYKIQQIALF